MPGRTRQHIQRTATSRAPSPPLAKRTRRNKVGSPARLDTGDRRQEGPVRPHCYKTFSRVIGGARSPARSETSENESRTAPGNPVASTRS